ncbi:MAG: hypothetical protein A3H27_00445 [Acidobacteria bacterium RIFCSPLOWO2_02_FULL_59_13]|nr:MAG: hypothetical protein A3H27_00445 [Acidobacteria bacterium RIFCSPLOWO2_02_FULL_59_13]
MLRLNFAVSIFPVGIMILGTSAVSGQDYPNKPIRIITGPAGAGSDLTARQIAQGISGPLGQPVITENRASTFLAAEAVSKAPPDGYALVVQGASLWIQPLLRKMPYDVVRDFSPISLLAREVSIVAVHPSVPAKAIKELVALAKARPGELNYGSAATGSPSHLAAELFKSMATVNIVRIAYKGSPPAITALITGEVQLVITDVGLLAPHVKSGRLRALAVTSAEPTALVPSLPTVAASGLPGYEWVGMTGILAPGKTPAPIINRLNQEIVRVLNLPDLKERFLNAGIEAVGSSPDEFVAIINSEIVRMGKVIRDAGIKTD